MAELILAALLGSLIGLAMKFLIALILKPKRIRSKLQKQGPVFMYSIERIQFLCVTDMEMVKEINLYTSWNLGKPSLLSKFAGALLGNGILTSNGQLWDKHKRIIALELFHDKVKGMVNLMVESTNLVMQS
ncbi:hypothetical protein DITRI_Ditri13aG0010400 [Diplodiscus trichospermus]